MMTPHTDNFSFDDLCNNLKDGVNFSFSRIASDGELNAIMGKSGQNCDAHPYDPKMGKELKAIIESPQRYILGLQNMAYNHQHKSGEYVFRPYIDLITEKYGHKWCVSDIIHHASIKGRFEPEFIPALEGKNIVLVAPSRLSGLRTKYPKSFSNMTHIVIPDVYCYKAFDETLKSLKKEVQEDDVVLYCASMMTKILIDRLFDVHGNNITQIDLGSSVEPYLNYNNRSYHKNIKSRV